MKWDIGVFFLEYLNSWIDVKDPFFCNQMPEKISWVGAQWNCSDIQPHALFVSLIPTPTKLSKKIFSQTEQASETKACHPYQWPNDLFVNLKVLKLVWV